MKPCQYGRLSAGRFAKAEVEDGDDSACRRGRGGIVPCHATEILGACDTSPRSLNPVSSQHAPVRHMGRMGGSDAPVPAMCATAEGAARWYVRCFMGASRHS